MGKNKFLKQPEKHLLSLICSKIYDTDLKIIAKNDTGVFEEKHYTALSNFKNTLDPIHLDYWYPLEVMELERWNNPGQIQEREHLRRAFCCLGIFTRWLEDKATFNFYNVVCPLAESLTHIGWDFFQPFDNLLEYALGKFDYVEDVAALQMVRLYVLIHMEEPESKILKQLANTLEVENTVVKLLSDSDEPDLSLGPFAGEDVTHKPACIFLGSQFSKAADSMQELHLRSSLKKLAERVSRM